MKSGFYWIKVTKDENWVIAEYDNYCDSWRFIGVNILLKNGNIYKVGEKLEHKENI